MNANIWLLGIGIALLTAINTICWGYAIRDVGDPQITLKFLFRLLINKWFILALISAFLASLLSYGVLKEMGILAGRFFLSLGIVATILACTLVLGEKLTVKELIGVTLITVGVILIGK